LRRFGITDGNRQTLTLGMLMTQLINPYRYGLFTLLYDAEAPEGEMLLDYADKQAKGLNHAGETPTQIIMELRRHADIALSVINETKPTKNKAEFGRLKNDIRAYHAMAWFYSQKAEAAIMTLRYKYSNDIKDLEAAAKNLQESVKSYKRLTGFTSAAYLYANSMQTQQRKIPMRGVNGTYKHWAEMLPVFEKELETFTYKIDSLKKNSVTVETKRLPFINAAVQLDYPLVTIDSAALIFSDTALDIKKYAAELKGLKGIQLPRRQMLQQGTVINFTCDKPVKVLVGYFKTQRSAFTADTVYVKAPELETNAGADDYGQSEIKISNGIAIEGMPAVNIHTYNFKAGKNTLKLGKGICLIIGFTDGEQSIPVYDAGMISDLKNKNIDWLFE
jgi:hypothetical protein